MVSPSARGTRVGGVEVPAPAARAFEPARFGRLLLVCVGHLSPHSLQFRESDPLARAGRCAVRPEQDGPLDRRRHSGTDEAVEPVIVRVFGPELPFIDSPSPRPQRREAPVEPILDRPDRHAEALGDLLSTVAIEIGHHDDDLVFRREGLQQFMHVL